jgi:hypothetical protein
MVRTATWTPCAAKSGKRAAAAQRRPAFPTLRVRRLLTGFTPRIPPVRRIEPPRRDTIAAPACLPDGD